MSAEDENEIDAGEADALNEEELEVVAGEDALVVVADLLYQELHSDPSLEKYFEKVDMADLAAKLRSLLEGVFGGEEWPSVYANSSTVSEGYSELASILLETLENTGGDNALLDSLDVLAKDKAEDERMQKFFEHIRNSEVVDEEGGEEHEDGEGGDDKAEAEEDANEADKDVTGADINTSQFVELRLDPAVVQAANDAWKAFISTASSREAAGEAIYAALFESAPSIQSLFVTPRAVQAMRFMNGLASFVQALSDPAALKILVETLGFGHLHLDVTIPRVVIFRDAIVDLLMVELGERFNSQAREGWKRLLNYVGGAIIYIKTNYAERINCLLKSWKKANHGDKEDKRLEDGEASASQEIQRQEEIEQARQTDKKKSGKFKNMWKSAAANGKAGAAAENAGAEHSGKEGKAAEGGTIGAQTVPTTYPEMFMFNAAVMGFGRSAWMNEVLACFDNIVTNVSNSARLQEECDVLGLRIARVVKGNVNLGEYKSCMLASLRSLLPKDWDSAHEVSWTWLWDNVERLVTRLQGQPAVWERALHTILSSWDEDMKFEIRKDIYNTFFAQAPAGQDYFKQSNTYLHIVADKIILMSLEIYQNPVKMVDDVSALGLRHVGYAIPTELFGPFVSACVDVMMTRTSDETTVESFRWSMGLISKMLVRTITEGSTIVMKAINTNSSKMLKKAIGCAPRGERAAWMLIVQVGTQQISPLAWSVEAGNFDAATAIVQDLLTFRADRARYYYGVDELFKRHPDLIRMLCDQAPDIVPKLLDGLIWRSRTTEAGVRRVNYYVKHLIINEEGSFNKALSWMSSTRDPKLVCHPVVVLVADVVWSKVAYKTFLYGKSWLFFTLLVFLISQSILEHLNDGENSLAERSAVFGCRTFIYLLSMTQLLYRHMRDTVKAYRAKETIKILCIPIPRYLKQWQDCANFLLTISLVTMLCLEPILWCWPHQDGKLFDANCSENSDRLYPYTIFSMTAMFLYYILLIDLTVISTRISAFALVCARMLSEVGLFLGSLAVSILTFSAAISVLKQDDVDFAGIPPGAYALLRMVMIAYDAKRYAKLRDEPVLLVMVFVFLIITIVFFLNMLIAQLSCAYSSVYADMVGYARLERAETIVDIMPSVPKKRWYAFVDSLNLQKRLEFNAGDIGVAGGISLREAANINPTTVDMIRRFGGSTSSDVQWPEDETDGQGDDKFERLEKLVQKALQRVTKGGGGRRGGGSGTGTGSGTQLSGSNSNGGGASGSGSEADE